MSPIQSFRNFRNILLACLSFTIFLVNSIPQGIPGIAFVYPKSGSRFRPGQEVVVTLSADPEIEKIDIVTFHSQYAITKTNHSKVIAKNLKSRGGHFSFKFRIPPFSQPDSQVYLLAQYNTFGSNVYSGSLIIWGAKDYVVIRKPRVGDVYKLDQIITAIWDYRFDEDEEGVVEKVTLYLLDGYHKLMLLQLENFDFFSNQQEIDLSIAPMMPSREISLTFVVYIRKRGSLVLRRYYSDYFAIC
ncbi:3199_t:CDS:1 [Acaulospora colombiana]|uniref:3199_t:CDS:1 n=1 Tax=Acaulospora colombiana TaxID=27376 RepID=A0ACA9LTL0_9GLOM|nr:3199_t:CDS:1 [Acaulospora colombiana]